MIIGVCNASSNGKWLFSKNKNRNLKLAALCCLVWQCVPLFDFIQKWSSSPNNRIFSAGVASIFASIEKLCEGTKQNLFGSDLNSEIHVAPELVTDAGKECWDEWILWNKHLILQLKEHSKDYLYVQTCENPHGLLWEIKC